MLGRFSSNISSVAGRSGHFRKMSLATAGAPLHAPLITSSAQPLAGMYRHHKNGQLYRVLDVVLHTETQQRMVLYEELLPSERNPDGLRFVRPFEMFTELVEHDGQIIPRFEKLPQMENDHP